MFQRAFKSIICFYGRCQVDELFALRNRINRMINSVSVCE